MPPVPLPKSVSLGKNFKYSPDVTDVLKNTKVTGVASSKTGKKPFANADNVDAKIPQKSTLFEKTFIGGAILGALGALAFPIYSIVNGEQSKNDSLNDVTEIQDMLKKSMPVISSLSSCSCMCIMFVLVLVLVM